MGEKKIRLLNAIVKGTERERIKLWTGLSDEQIERFIQRNSKKITFAKLKVKR